VKCTISKNIIKRDLVFDILNYIRGKPGGATIGEISRQMGFSRNTVSEYISILTQYRKIFSKKMGIYHFYFSTETGRNPEFEILEYIRDKPRGVTITEISKKKGFSRNTVSKYISILAIKKKIFSRKIGTYHLFFSAERNYFPKMFYISFYKGLLASLKEKYPNDGEVFKYVGRNCLEFIDFSFDRALSRELKGIKVNRFVKLFSEVFGNINPSSDIAEPTVDLSVRRDGENGIVTIIKFINSEYLQNTEDFIYHFYIIAGMIEGIWKREINKDIICNVETVHIADDKANSFIELSIKINPNK